MNKPDKSLASKTAEKEYLRRTGGGGEWEREKPFSPPRSETFADSVRLLHDFAAVTTVLELTRSDRIIDLGAGGGWSTDLLRRLNRRPVAVDISYDMLTIARQRPLQPPLSVVAGDFEHLPFVAGSFDKAVCLNALHHVPDMPLAVAEIARVLTRTGAAVFCEPGAGHASKAESVQASRDYGVLEQDIRLEDLLRACLDVGFEDVRVFPVAYVIPEFALSPDDWECWRRFSRSKRPARGWQKIWLGFLQIAGLEKRSRLFQDDLGIRLVRLLEQHVATHPFVVASKTRLSGHRKTELAAAVHASVNVRSTSPFASVVARVTLTNTGAVAWTTSSEDAFGSVGVGIQLLAPDGRMINKDFARSPLRKDVAVGETRTVEFEFTAPEEAGDYLLKFDLVAEGLRWFEGEESVVSVCPITVSRATCSPEPG